MAKYYIDWAEILFFSVLVIGFIISLFAKSAVISYLIIFVAGMMSGRFMYERKEKLKFPYYLIIVGFLIGYLLAAAVKPNQTYGNINVMIILFSLGALLSYYLHDKRIIKSIQY